MKVILEFDTTDPDQKPASVRAQKATEAYIAMRILDNWLRDQIKYKGNDLSEEAIEVLQKTRTKLNHIQEELGIDMEDLE